jgi:hypothetical protein
MKVTQFPSLPMKVLFAIAAALALRLPSEAQNPTPQSSEVNIFHGYQTHQSVDLGGHIPGRASSTIPY